MENRTGAEEIRRSAFRRNNRTVLQTINVMREDYTPLESVADALENHGIGIYKTAHPRNADQRYRSRRCGI